MDITILGTAAAEGWPASFCGCDICRRAREVGGKNIRSRASVQFGPAHKIDLPPDTWYHEAVIGADFSGLEHLFITHSHQDHWSPGYLEYLREPFAHDGPPLLSVYGTSAVIKRGVDELASHGIREGGHVGFTEIEPFIPVQAGEMTFTPITASHMSDELCLCYVVSDGAKTVLYASDTGWFPEETWEYLESIRLDGVISECTCGPNKSESYHLDFDHLFAMKERLENSGVIGADCVFVATHFSHNVGFLHEELEHILNQRHIQVAYDGMRISL
ncbi:MAG: MBL fold metallo-hydrolase [Armatimonadetes bacterium]|nr:MBL fold metallo-hydrolase [Armatimonadota bacterium]